MLWYNIGIPLQIVVVVLVGGHEMPEKHKPGEIAKKSGQYPIGALVAVILGRKEQS